MMSVEEAAGIVGEPVYALHARDGVRFVVYKTDKGHCFGVERPEVKWSQILGVVESRSEAKRCVRIYAHLLLTTSRILEDGCDWWDPQSPSPDRGIPSWEEWGEW
jgi:hypothetical protein